MVARPIGPVVMPEAPRQSKTKLLNAAISMIRAKGYNATRVDDVCAEAGVTKGSFFHHFDSKDDMALAAAGAWRDHAAELFSNAPYHRIEDPLDRLLGYLDFRKEMLAGGPEAYACFAGTVIQETYATHPELVDACAQGFSDFSASFTPLIAAAMEKYRVDAAWTADSLAGHMMAVLQGGFILAKADRDTTAAAASIDHLKRYITLVFDPHRGGG